MDRTEQTDLSEDHRSWPRAWVKKSPCWNRGSARISVDGRWIAYGSTETGKLEVYVQSVEGAATEAVHVTPDVIKHRLRGTREHIGDTVEDDGTGGVKDRAGDVLVARIHDEARDVLGGVHG